MRKKIDKETVRKKSPKANPRAAEYLMQPQPLVDPLLTSTCCKLLFPRCLQDTTLCYCST